MIGNYLKVALRNIVKHKSVSLINLFGLTTGMVCVLVISIWISDELSYDKFHSRHDRIYRLAYDEVYNGETLTWAYSWSPWSVGLKDEFPEVVDYTRMIRSSVLLTSGTEQFVIKDFLRAENSFFNIFDAEVVQGIRSDLLDDPFDLVMTESAAKKYLNSSDAVGRQLIIENETYTVSGVIKDWPEQSHFHFEMLGSYNYHLVRDPEFYSEWIFTYLLLNENVSLPNLTSKLPEFIESQPRNSEFGDVTLRLQPVDKIHLYSSRQGELDTNGDIVYVYIFSSAAALIFLITLLNFVNLTTAGSIYRVKEIGLRKVIGANRAQLARQFVGESMLMTMMSILVAVAVAQAILPFVNAYFGLDLALQNLVSWQSILVLLSGVLLISMAVSLYPAAYLSRLQPKVIFKKESEHRSSRSYFRNAMIVVQFLICIVLLTSSLIIKDQFSYMLSKDPGYDLEQVIQIPLHNASVRSDFSAFKQRVRQYPGIREVSAMSYRPGVDDPWIGNFYPEGGGPDGDNYIVAHMLVEEDFLSTFGIDLLAGRTFSREMADSSYAFIINEAAARDLDWKDPIGKQLTTFGTKKGTVIGVVEDFHFETFMHEIKPMILHIDKRYFGYATIKLSANNYGETIDAIRKEWDKMETRWPMEYSFLKSDFEKEYEAEAKMSNTISVFSYISILVGCLGLWGITLFTIKMKLKEIGIRKIFGADFFQVFATLINPIIKIVVLALLLGLPLSYYLGLQWLNNFAYRVTMDPLIFVLASTLILVMALLTISFQSMQASRYKPVDLVRDE